MRDLPNLVSDEMKTLRFIELPYVWVIAIFPLNKVSTNQQISHDFEKENKRTNVWTTQSEKRDENKINSTFWSVEKPMQCVSLQINRQQLQRIDVLILSLWTQIDRMIK